MKRYKIEIKTFANPGLDRALNNAAQRFCSQFVAFCNEFLSKNVFGYYFIIHCIHLKHSLWSSCKSKVKGPKLERQLKHYCN